MAKCFIIYIAMINFFIVRMTWKQLSSSHGIHKPVSTDTQQAIEGSNVCQGLTPYYQTGRMLIFAHIILCITYVGACILWS